MTKIYEGGRYFVGIANYFIEFPRHQKTMEYARYGTAYGKPLVCRTADGFAVTLEVSFQYQLTKNDIGNLYKENSINYEQTFNRQAKDVIMQTAAKYKAISYWSERANIVAAIQTEMQSEFMKNGAVCKSVQILYIDLPSSYENKIVETQVENQLQKQKELERESLLIRKSIDVLASENDAKIKEIISNATATAYETTQSAVATGIQSQIDSEVTITTALKTDLGLSGKDLQKYIYYLAIMEKPESKLL